MKGRSHRFPEPHEDWGDGSWTVDCVCGVNFDDGEEMVNCDECGVWVHTRCSRYVKGDEVFACDKCKGKNNRNDSEEKEVAQLLVELPTKTLGLESSSAANAPARRPFRLWTEIPMEERVHVQGVPGGDPSLFGGSSSIFSRELWKCTGYVPKKFNSKYREFPCWDEDEKCEVNNTCENGHQADSGPGALFSLSKEKVLDVPVTSLVDVRGIDDLASNPKPGMKDVKTQECRVKLKRCVSGMEKEKSSVSGVSHSNKRRKEESGSSKDRTKKKVKASNSEEEEKKGISNSSYRTIDEHRDRELDSMKDGSQSIRNDKSNDTVVRETVNGNLEVDNGDYKTSNTTVVACSENVPQSDGNGLEQTDDKAGNQVCIVLKTSATNSTPSPERKDVGKNNVKAESEAKAKVDTLDPNVEVSFESTVKPNDGDVTDSTAQDFEAAGSLLTVSQSQGKLSCSGTPQRGDKANQPNSNSLSKHSAQATHPPLAPNSTATLSDEELALLLHQELNSSPRVPRIPRVRQPGSLQLASPAATSLLIKRCSSSGGKDHGSVSRRKSKEAFKDSFRSSRDGDERTLKSSNGRRVQDNGDMGGGSTKGEENEPPRTILSARKLLPPSSTTSTSSGPCSSNEVNDHNVTSPQTSPRIASDDVPVAHRTLPGLINEIMSKGKRMTYEELCNAVLPHWPHLRKHNGERYAYSSHSQAVLDCLRNRHEWARLVDRGPKTNSGRKKRRTEAEDSEDDEISKALENGSGKNVECQREEFPKGKRKARKRRRLALQGRGLKDIRKIRKAEILHKDGPYSDSSEESMFSEDEEVHGSSRPSNVRGETSGSSEENGTR